MQNIPWVRNQYISSLFLLAIISISAFSSNIWYVDQNAVSGWQNGTNWANAFLYLQDALSAAYHGDKIYIAQGTYRPDQNSANPNGTGDRNASFNLVGGVAIYGGFQGGITESLDGRDYLSHKTILNGRLPSSYSVYHVIKAVSQEHPIVLDGLTIYEGRAKGSDPNNCGSGIYSLNAQLAISRCQFKKNGSAQFGGAIYSKDSDIAVSTTGFYNNNARYGSAIYCIDSVVDCNNITFYYNMGNNWSGDDVHGAIHSNNSHVRLRNGILQSLAEDCELQAFNSFVEISFCNIKGGQGNIFIDPLCSFIWGQGNSSFDPFLTLTLQLETAGWRWDIQQQNWVTDWRTSPCIDAGDPNESTRNEPNCLPADPNIVFVNNRINMGAFGGTQYASIAPAHWVLPPDMNYDRKVTLQDISVISELWLENGYNLACDLDRNNNVNILDLFIMINRWMDCNVCQSVLCGYECQRELRSLSTALIVYANDYYGEFPDDLEVLIYEADLLRIPSCTQQCTYEGLTAYAYRGGDLNDTFPAQAILVHDRYQNHNGLFRNVLFVDGHIDSLTEQEFQAAIIYDNQIRQQRGYSTKPAE